MEILSFSMHFWRVFASSAHPNVLSYASINTWRAWSPLSKLWMKFKKKWGEIFEEIEWSFEKDTLLKKKKRSKLILKNIILVSIQ